jgi:hypothetical protein
MNKFRSLFILFIAAGIASLSSCDNGNGPEDLPKKTGVLIVNEGDFGSGNGSISFYDEETMTVTNNIVANANAVGEIAATIQSLFVYDGVGYLVCNASDKIEFIDIDDYKYLANPETDISQPRYMTVAGDKGYITCWGPWGENWTLPDSYVAVLDLDTRKVIDSLECGSGPEEILALGNKLYVANSYETTVTVIDLDDNASSVITFEAAPQHFVPDAAGNVWVSMTTNWGAYPAEKAGLQAININTLTKGTLKNIPDISGPIAVDAAGENIYVLTPVSIKVYKTTSNEVAADPIITGENFYGIGYNVTTDILYVSDNQGFAGNGRIYAYLPDGTLIDEQIVGIGPNGFAFK